MELKAKNNDDTKPTILWLFDVKGWAYDNVVSELSSLLKNYNHVTMTEVIGIIEIEKYDIVVTFSPKMVVNTKFFDNVVFGMGSKRSLRQIEQ